MDIILASQSPRRKQLLKILGFDFEVKPSFFDETIIEYKNNPKEYCEKLSLFKAKEIAKLYPTKLVIGADTIVVLNNTILPKPKDNEEAKSFLKMLSNNSHHVFTGISFSYQQIDNSFSEKTLVTFKKLSNDEINYYVENSNPMDKAGAYGIQDWSSIFVEKIEGCYFNVVGLPISKVYQKILKFYPKLIENLLVTKLENM